MQTTYSPGPTEYTPLSPSQSATSIMGALHIEDTPMPISPRTVRSLLDNPELDITPATLHLLCQSLILYRPEA